MRQRSRGEAPNLVGMMKLTTLTCCLAVAGAVTLGAQSSETTTKTKIQVKDGKDVTVTGCVEARSGGGYVLTHVADKSGAQHRYTLVSDDDDFSKHVGHRVQIEGKAADRDHGKMKIKSETKMDGVDKDTHSKITASGDDLSFMPYLGVKHMKMIAASCP
jgi:hypothetical protein